MERVLEQDILKAPAQAIINIMPPHETYIEPFLGSGQILKRKPKAQKTIGFDIDKSCVDAFDYTCSNMEIFCADAFQFIPSYSWTGDELVYFDPPYPHATRSTRRYQYDLVDSSHIRLLQLVNNIDARIIISSYPNFIYDEALAGWHTFTYQTMTRGGVKTEQVWYNYDLTKIHYHTFAGCNRTDRQRIKRKAERWRSNYLKLPQAERQAILSSLLESDSDKL